MDVFLNEPTAKEMSKLDDASDGHSSQDEGVQFHSRVARKR